MPFGLLSSVTDGGQAGPASPPPRAGDLHPVGGARGAPPPTPISLHMIGFLAVRTLPMGFLPTGSLDGILADGTTGDAGEWPVAMR